MTTAFRARLTAGAMLFSSLFAFAPAAHAATTSYSDRSAWQTAAGGGTGDIVDNLNSGSRDRGLYEFDSGFSVPNRNSTTDIDGSGYARTFLQGSSISYVYDPITDSYNTVYGPANVATITFDNPTTALGFDVSAWCNGNICRTNSPSTNSLGVTIDVLIDGITSTSYTLPTGSNTVSAFVGFVSDTAFTTFSISTSAVTGWHGIDNVEAFSAPNTVPLPAGFPLMLAGLGAFYFLRRRAA